MKRKLTFPLPFHATAGSRETGFFGVPWTIPTILSALNSGGWFRWENEYCFDSREAAMFATSAQSVMEALRATPAKYN